MIRGIRPRGSRQLATPLAPHSRPVGVPGSQREPAPVAVPEPAIPAPQEWLEPPVGREAASEPVRRPGDLLREKAKKAAVAKKRLSDEAIEAVIDRLARRLASEP